MDIKPIEKIKKTPQNVLESVSKYQKKNKEKVNEKYRNYYQRLKQDPERYVKYLERHREYRNNKKDLKNSEIKNV